MTNCICVKCFDFPLIFSVPELMNKENTFAKEVYSEKSCAEFLALSRLIVDRPPRRHAGSKPLHRLRHPTHQKSHFTDPIIVGNVKQFTSFHVATLLNCLCYTLLLLSCIHSALWEIFCLERKYSKKNTSNLLKK